ncbi:MAG: hypothetical protein ACLRXQ_13920 [Phascolarctobacterium faecium]
MEQGFPNIGTGGLWQLRLPKDSDNQELTLEAIAEARHGADQPENTRVTNSRTCRQI